MTNSPTAAAPVIATDLPCKTCGYNLRTRGTADACPECATPVADSIAFQRTGGRNLKRTQWASAQLAIAALISAFIALIYSRLRLTLSPGFQFAFIAPLAARILLDVTLLAGIYQLATSRPLGTSKWTLAGIACLTFAAAHAAIDAIIGTPGLWALYAATGIPAGSTLYMKLQLFQHISDLFLLAAGAIFVRGLARQFKRPWLFRMAFAWYGVAIFLAALQASLEATPLFPRSMPGRDLPLLIALHLRLPLLVDVPVIALTAIAALWIAVALIARQLNERANSQSSPPDHPPPPSRS